MFKYNGYTFEPIRKLTSKEEKQELSVFTREHLYYEKRLNMNNYPHKSVDYNYNDFYKASGNSECDIFKCIETGLLYLPGSNELFGWK